MTGLVMVGLALLVAGGLATAPAGAATPRAVNQCNGTDNVGGQSVACDVTVTNKLDVATGTTSSAVRVTECHGAANTTPTCTRSTSAFTALTTSITQCDGSGSGGGGTVTCAVHVINNIVGTASSRPATVNQCNGSGSGGGTEPTVRCKPIGNTTGATITQCNNSGNGGGATVRVQCTVLPSTRTAALPVSINQCNRSGNGGGATVTCTASLVNKITTRTPVTTSPSATASASTTSPIRTPAPTSPSMTAVAPVPPASGTTTPAFVPPAGLTGDTKPATAGHRVLVALSLGLLLAAASAFLMLRRRSR